MILWYLGIGALIFFFLFYILAFWIQGEKNKRNPVSLMINHDKRFKNITCIYSHKFDELERGD